ncbi:MAG: hypothetical protein D6689_15425 [Deltaproteobacteria bacterium]|nr:MAG: hypothetical protein D6689_15425 [Deltaproteobacteria bacterium]
MEATLQVFPRGLDQSILVGVLVGVWILLAMTEWFGWVFVGLVVPGYLGSLFVILPAAAVTVVVESVLTYTLARTISDRLARADPWAPFFGRDRFFLIVLVSVVVRQASQLWLVPAGIAWIDTHFGTHLSLRQDFFSIGLVLVPLTANTFWKLDLRRGMFQTGVPVALTYAALAYVLLPRTNLSFAAFELTYENVALDFLGSAKAYIILLTGAWFAARMNLRYGWDYNGILIPALIALVWVSPLTVAVTFAEVIALVLFTRAITALPLLRTANLEGPRKTALVFTVGFALKFATAWLLARLAPDFEVVQLFGFGYVLTSLLAVKILAKREVGRVIAPAAAVSAAAFVTGVAMSFALQQLAPAAATARASTGPRVVATTRLLRSARGVAELARARARPAGTAPPAQRLARLWASVDRWLAGDARARADVAAAADAAGVRLIELSDEPGRFALVEREERLAHQVGRDTAVLVPGAAGPVLAVPRPRGDPAAAALAATLCDALACRAILFAGVDVPRGAAGDATAAAFRATARSLRGAPALWIDVTADVTAGAPTIHLRHTLPPGIDLSALATTTPAITWRAPPGFDRVWSESRQLAVLRMHPDDARARAIAAAGAIAREPGGAAALLWPPDRGRDAEPPLSDTELVVLQREVIAPLSAAAETGDGGAVAWAAHVAALLDYRVARIDDCGDGGACWVLHRPDDLRGRVAVAVRADAPRAVGVEIPHPAREPGSFGAGFAAWTSLGAAFVIVDPADDPAANPTAADGAATPFHAAHEAISDALADRAGAAILQLRGYAPWRPVDAPVVVGLGAPVAVSDAVPAAVRDLLRTGGPLAWLPQPIRFADGGADVVALAAAGTPQIVYSRATAGPPVAVMWLSAAARAPMAPAHDPAWSRALATAGVVPVDGDVASALVEPARGAAPAGALDELVSLADALSRSRNPQFARALTRAARRLRGARWTAVRSADLGATYAVVVADRRGAIERAAVRLATASAECATAPLSPADVRTIRLALARRCRTVRVVGRRPR